MEKAMAVAEAMPPASRGGAAEWLTALLQESASRIIRLRPDTRNERAVLNSLAAERIAVLVTSAGATLDTLSNPTRMSWHGIDADWPEGGLGLFRVWAAKAGAR